MWSHKVVREDLEIQAVPESPEDLVSLPDLVHHVVLGDLQDLEDLPDLQTKRKILIMSP